jgi:hypothetical protein
MLFRENSKAFDDFKAVSSQQGSAETRIYLMVSRCLHVAASPRQADNGCIEVTCACLHLSDAPGRQVQLSAEV